MRCSHDVRGVLKKSMNECISDVNMSTLKALVEVQPFFSAQSLGRRKFENEHIQVTNRYTFKYIPT